MNSSMKAILFCSKVLIMLIAFWLCLARLGYFAHIWAEQRIEGYIAVPTLVVFAIIVTCGLTSLAYFLFFYKKKFIIRVTFDKVEE